jgi:hypothetical protein
MSIRTDQVNLELEHWNTGTLEYWNIGSVLHSIEKHLAVFAGYL